MTSISDLSPEFIWRNPAPKVTVCVVTYNQKDFIGECLQSLVDQKTDFAFEILVGDDCSTDGTSEIIEEFVCKYPDLVFCFKYLKNKGPYGNYRFIHAAARGDFVAHVDGDDYWLPGKLNQQVVFMAANPDCILSGHGVYLLNNSGELLEVKRNVPEISDVGVLVANNNFLCHSSTMYRRHACLSSDIDFESIDFQMHVDRVRGGRIGYISDILGVYRANPNGVVGSTYLKSTTMYYKNISAIRHAQRFCLSEAQANRAIFDLSLIWVRNFVIAHRDELAVEILLSDSVSGLSFWRKLMLRGIFFLRHLLRGIKYIKRALVE